MTGGGCQEQKTNFNRIWQIPLSVVLIQSDKIKKGMRDYRFISPQKRLSIAGMAAAQPVTDCIAQTAAEITGQFLFCQIAQIIRFAKSLECFQKQILHILLKQILETVLSGDAEGDLIKLAAFGQIFRHRQHSLTKLSFFYIRKELKMNTYLFH